MLFMWMFLNILQTKPLWYKVREVWILHQCLKCLFLAFDTYKSSPIFWAAVCTAYLPWQTENTVKASRASWHLYMQSGVSGTHKAAMSYFYKAVKFNFRKLIWIQDKLHSSTLAESDERWYFVLSTFLILFFFFLNYFGTPVATRGAIWGHVETTTTKHLTLLSNGNRILPSVTFTVGWIERNLLQEEWQPE